LVTLAANFVTPIFTPILQNNYRARVVQMDPSRFEEVPAAFPVPEELPVRPVTNVLKARIVQGLTIKLPSVETVQRDSIRETKLKNHVFLVFLASTTMRRNNRSASLVARTSTRTLQKKKHARVVRLENPRFQEAPSATSVHQERFPKQETSAHFVALGSGIMKLVKQSVSRLIQVTTDKVRQRKLNAPQESLAWAVTLLGACLVKLESFKMNQRKHRAKSVQKARRTTLKRPRRATSAHLESTLPSRDQKSVKNVH
jgi:hypothetical protein